MEIAGSDCVLVLPRLFVTVLTLLFQRSCHKPIWQALSVNRPSPVFLLLVMVRGRGISAARCTIAMAFGLYVGVLHCRGRRSSLQFPLASVSQFSAPEWAVLRSGCTSDPTVWYSMHSSACSCMKSRESLQADAANCGIQIFARKLAAV